jgi:DNA-binding MarR family transcriptional regulator
MSIYNRGKASMTELSDLTYVSPPSAFIMVDRLFEKGILVRKRSHKNCRKVMVKISTKPDKGIQQIEEDIGYETVKKWCEVIKKIKTVHDKDGLENRTDI